MCLDKQLCLNHAESLRGQHGGRVVSAAASQPAGQQELVFVEFVCSPCACVGFLPQPKDMQLG